MKYLKEYDTQAAYTAAKSSLILPNVSLVTENNKVEYNPLNPTPPTPSHDYVEIGGVKWATMNVGANSITDTGLYFQWADTQGYTAAQVGCNEGQKCFQMDGEDYKYYDTDNFVYTKYNEEDGLNTLQASDDAVTAAWGGNWRTPTKEDFDALSAAVTTEWVTDYQGSGVNGRLMTDKTDSSKKLFFPACGYAYDGFMYDIGSYSLYYGSSVYIGDVERVYGLVFKDDSVNWNEDLFRTS